MVPYPFFIIISAVILMQFLFYTIILIYAKHPTTRKKLGAGMVPYPKRLMEGRERTPGGAQDHRVGLAEILDRSRH
jgi:hypothetical protein